VLKFNWVLEASSGVLFADDGILVEKTAYGRRSKLELRKDLMWSSENLWMGYDFL